MLTHLESSSILKKNFKQVSTTSISLPVCCWWTDLKRYSMLLWVIHIIGARARIGWFVSVYILTCTEFFPNTQEKITMLMAWIGQPLTSALNQNIQEDLIIAWTLHFGAHILHLNLFYSSRLETCSHIILWWLHPRNKGSRRCRWHFSGLGCDFTVFIYT